MTNQANQTNVTNINTTNTPKPRKEVSKRYLQINSSELKKQCDSIITGLGYSFDCKLSKRRSTRHTLTYKIDTDMRIMGDVVKPMISITNSYRGESALIIQFGFYRLVCTNGLMVSDVGDQETPNVIKIRHTRGVKNETKVKQLEYEIAAAITRCTEFIASMEATLSKPMSLEQQNKMIDDLPLPNRVKAVVRQRLSKPVRTEDAGNNVWSVWNIVNEANRTESKTENAAMTRDEKLLGNILRLAA